jgi:hypothetical protein
VHAVIDAVHIAADNGLGDVVYLHLFGLGLVFLNSPEAAFNLLDSRGSIYSDKPALVMVGELCVIFYFMSACQNIADPFDFVPADAAAKTW